MYPQLRFTVNNWRPIFTLIIQCIAQYIVILLQLMLNQLPTMPTFTNDLFWGFIRCETK
jgi:hypothetical protein